MTILDQFVHPFTRKISSWTYLRCFPYQKRLLNPFLGNTVFSEETEHQTWFLSIVVNSSFINRTSVFTFSKMSLALLFFVSVFCISETTWKETLTLNQVTFVSSAHHITRESHTVKLGYYELGWNEQIFRANWSFCYINNPVITNPGYNEQKCPVPSCSL